MKCLGDRILPTRHPHPPVPDLPNHTLPLRLITFFFSNMRSALSIITLLCYRGT